MSKRGGRAPVEAFRKRSGSLLYCKGILTKMSSVAPIYQYMYDVCWVLIIFQLALANGTVCGQHEVFDSDLDSCRKCNLCCNRTINGHLINLTPEPKCIGLKKGSFLYACLEMKGEDVCPSHTYPGDDEPPMKSTTDLEPPMKSTTEPPMKSTAEPPVAVTNILNWILALGVSLGLIALVVILALLFYFCYWRPRQKKRRAPPEDDTLTVVKITEPDLEKDEETPQDILVEAVQATTGKEQSMKGPTAAEHWGSDKDSSTDKPLEMRETSRKNVFKDPPGQAARVQPEEEEPLLPGEQNEAQFAPVQDSQKPGSPGTASSHMDQNNPETLHYDAKNQMNKLEPMDANFSSQAKPGASE